MTPPQEIDLGLKAKLIDEWHDDEAKARRMTYEISDGTLSLMAEVCVADGSLDGLDDPDAALCSAVAGICRRDLLLSAGASFE